MTDRWKDALRDLDDVGPDESIYRRAAQGPTRSDLPPPPNRSSRIVAGVTAFAVFAAAAVFAWEAFRPEAHREGPPIQRPDVVSLGEEGSILWPARSTDALAELQANADADRGGTRWLLDPSEVTDAFVGRVLGWGAMRYEVDLEHREDAQVVAHVTRAPESCPPIPPALRDADAAACYAGNEEILLAQPVSQGDGGIWAVVSVTSPAFALGVVPGQVITNGGSVDVSAQVPDELPVVVGSVIGDWYAPENCSGASGTARLTSADGRIRVAIGSDRDFGTHCGERAPAFVWVASSTWRMRAGADPIVGDSTAYVAVTAVPIVVTIPENAPAQGLEAFIDPLGWRVDYPSDWTVTPIATQDRVTITGAAFSNVTPGVASPNAATPSPIGLDPDNVPPDAVEVVITHLEGGPMPDLTTDDTRFPVSLEGLGCPLDNLLLCGASVRGGGLDFSIEVRRGANASAEDIAAAEALVASMRFRSLRLGEQAHGWASLGRPALYPKGEGTPAWVGGGLGVVYVMRGPKGTNALDLDPDTCGEGQNQTWDPATLEIWIQCPEYLGTGDVRYDRFGSPHPGNAPKFQVPLEAHPIITAWDGSLLVYLDGSIDQLPQLYWP
jgi:hypothetical protein